VSPLFRCPLSKMSAEDRPGLTPPKKKLPLWAKIAIGVGIGTVLTAITLGLVFGVAVPQIVQQRVNGSTLQFTSVTITNPQNNSFTVHALGVLANAGPDTAYMQATPVSVYYLGNLLGTMNLPQTTINGGQDTMLDITSDFQIPDRTIFDQFAKDLVSVSSLNWHLSASPDVQALGITFKSIKFEKDVSISGLAGLPNVTVTKFLVSSPDGINVNINSTAAIFNPSIVSMIPVGTLYMNLYFNGTLIASVVSVNASLVSGINYLDITGRVTTGVDPKLLSELFTGYLGTTVSLLTSQTTSSSIGLYAPALKSLPLKIALPGGNFTLISGIQIQNLALDFTTGQYPAVSSSIKSALYIPFQIPVSILQTKLTFALIYNQKQISQVAVPLVPAVSNQLNGTLSLSFTGAPMTLLDNTTFSQFGKDLLLNGLVTAYLVGTASALVQTPLGVLTLSGLPFSSEVPLKGFNSFSNFPIEVQSVDVQGGVPGQMVLGLNIAVPNPSSVLMNVGTTSMDLFYQGTFVGTTSFSLNLQAFGNNLFSVQATYVQPGQPTDLDVGRTFLSRFLTGLSNQVTLKGSTRVAATTIPVLQQAFSSLVTTTTVPGLPTVLIQSSMITVNIEAFQIQVKTVTNNPFSAQIALECLNFDVFNNASLGLTGKITNFCFNPPFTIAGKSTATTSGITLSDIQSIFNIPSSVYLNGQLSFFVPDVGGFHQYVDFQQANVPATLFKK
jgi:hypothetical protein